MNYADLSVEELRILIDEYQKEVDVIKEKIGEVALAISEKLSMIELERKIGSIGDAEKEYLRKMLAQTTVPNNIDTAENAKL
jgi:hypothetical protein